MEKVKGLVIAPYEGLKETFLSVAPDYADRIDLSIYVGNLQDGLEIVKTIEDRFDIIISRGGTATLIRENTDKFVQDTRLSGYDYMRTLKMVENIDAKKAMVGYPNIISGASSVRVFMQTDISLFSISSSDELVPLLKKLKQEGYGLIVGDTVTCRNAELLEMNNLMLISGEESVRRSIEEAIIIASCIKKNSERLFYLEKLHDSTNWSTAVLNQNNEIVAYFSREWDPVIPFTTIQQENDGENKDIFLNTDNGMVNLVYSQIDKELMAVNFRKVWAQNEVRRGIEVHTYSSEINDLRLVRSIHGEKLIDIIEKTAKSTRSALLIGDTGAGKQELAEAIHRLSVNKMNPFFLIDCATVSKNELENFFSLFGNRKGTLCFLSLDCLDDDLQKYLLKVLSRLNRNYVRIIGVANSVINDQLASHRFDAKLFKMFAETTIFVPGVAEEKRDLGPIIRQMILSANQAQGCQVTGIDSDALACLENFKWNYNFDQMSQVVSQLVLMSADNQIHLDEVKRTLEPLSGNTRITIELNGTLEEMEKAIIEKVIRQEGGNVTKAAERLGIGRSTIWRKVK